MRSFVFWWSRVSVFGRFCVSSVLPLPQNPTTHVETIHVQKPPKRRAPGNLFLRHPRIHHPKPYKPQKGTLIVHLLVTTEDSDLGPGIPKHRQRGSLILRSFCKVVGSKLCIMHSTRSTLSVSFCGPGVSACVGLQRGVSDAVSRRLQHCICVCLCLC